MYNTLAHIGQSLYMIREYKCLGEGNILVNPPLLSRIQGYMMINLIDPEQPPMLCIEATMCNGDQILERSSRYENGIRPGCFVGI